MILNKVDQVMADDSGNILEELEKEIRDINSLASIIRSTRCQVELSKTLDCQAYDASVEFHFQSFFLIIIIISSVSLIGSY